MTTKPDIMLVLLFSAKSALTQRGRDSTTPRKVSSGICTKMLAADPLYIFLLPHKKIYNSAPETNESLENMKTLLDTFHMYVPSKYSINLYPKYLFDIACLMPWPYSNWGLIWDQ